MSFLRAGLRAVFRRAEDAFDRIFGAAGNPLYQLGALGFMLLWIVTVSGIYLYMFFDTSVVGAYSSVQAITEVQWYAGGIMRSLHRYASDGLVLVMMVHLVREFSLDRYRGPRWFTWFTGIPVLWLVFLAGISGYWLVWDQLAQYVAIVGAEWLDWLPIFGEPIARNFLAKDSLGDRFFTLLLFLHIAVPLFLLLVLWIHLQRVSRPRINPSRGLAAGTGAMLLVLSLVEPAISQAPADLGAVPAVVGLDWYYLAFFPLLDLWPAGTVWALATGATLLLLALPWLPPARRRAPAAVHLAQCNGCGRCVVDCPFNAIIMQPRTDGRPYAEEAAVNPALCVACGICVGACPTSTPFRRTADLETGIDLPDLSLRMLREQTEQALAELAGAARIMVFACSHGAKPSRPPAAAVATVVLPCLGQLPPPFIDYVLSRGLADGVMLTGCGSGRCYYRLGARWTEQRLAGERDPGLRGRVPRERVDLQWHRPGDRRALESALAAFAARLAALDRAGAEAADD